MISSRQIITKISLRLIFARDNGLRRTFATRLAHKGLDIYKISRLLGHEDVQTTQKRYAHHCTESLRIGVDILDVDFNLTSVGEKEGLLSASKLL